jgi:hypothetical protein
LHVVVSAQNNPPGQGAEAPGLQVPKPLQELAAVSIAPLHEAEPHETLLDGYMHAPVLSHPVAPQAPEVAQVIAQHLPVPVVPQMPLVHWLAALQVEPFPPVPTHVPEAPGFMQKSAADAQSWSEPQDVLHEVALAHAKPPAHDAAVPAWQVPWPLHVLAGVKTPAAHAAPEHVVPLG